MRSKAIFMALLALAFGARAATVSQSDAKIAALGWASTGGHLGARIGTMVESAATFTTTNGASFHAVKMYGGGTVFMAGDDETPPVIAFTDCTNDFSNIDRKSTLWALLSRDISTRYAAKSETPAVYAEVSDAASSAAEEWSVLRARGSALVGIRLSYSASARYNAPGDIRVPQLMESTWDQAEAGGTHNKSDSATCYNYYTPQDASGTIQDGKKGNAVCGCVATAMGQVMFYHKYPAAATVPEVTDTCWFDTTEFALPVSGETYDWASMEASPTATSSEAARMAIGRLTADAGRSVGMHYTFNDSGSYTFKAAKSLNEVFNYGQAALATDDSYRTSIGSLTADTTIGKVMFANFDAGYPIMLGISGDGGHSICADGYGYHNGTPYVHLNMGWSGSMNLWYNLPDIACPGSYTFTVVEDAAYNIIPDGAGKGIVSGRVVAEDGAPVASATVSVYDAGTDSLVTQLVTSAYGVWGAALAQGEYDFLIKDAAEVRTGEITGVSVAAPVQSETDFSWQSPNGEIESAKYPAVKEQSELGNSWGNDIVLLDPRIRIVTSAGVTNLYTSLDRAIAGARVLAGAGEVPELEILRDAELNEDATVDFNCSLRAATGDESSTSVVRPSGAVVTVAAGATFTASNCVFGVTGSVPVVVSEGGEIVVGPGFAAERVAAEAVDGFNVKDYVTSDILVECAAATEIGHVFGFAETDDPAALSNSVGRLYASFDADAEIRGNLEEVSPGSYRLVWGELSVPIESAVGYYVTSDGVTNTSAKVDLLFSRYENALAAGLFDSTAEIVLIGTDPEGLTRDLVVSSPLVIRGVNGASLTPSADAHVIVTNGGSLVVKDLSVGGRTGDTFIRVHEGSSMTLSGGAALSALVCTGNDDLSKAGPIAVYPGGAFRLEEGSSITGCSATGSSLGGQHGGAVYVYAGGTIDLAGGSITGCSSQYGFGGGVYVADGGDVVVSGPSVVAGNVNKKGKADDIYLLYDESDVNTITVTGSAAGGRIGVRYSSGSGNAAGMMFATAGSLSSAHDIEASAEAFFNDAGDDRVAQADGSDIVWVSVEDVVEELEPIDPADTEAMSYAVVKVDYPDGFAAYGATAYWKSLKDALASLEGAAGEATATLLQSDWFDGDLAVGCDLTLTSGTSEKFDVQRAGDASFTVGEGASLTVVNVRCSDADLVNPQSKAFFDVTGGELVFDGVAVTNVFGNGPIGSTVTASGGASVVLRNGSEIMRSMNGYDKSSGSLPFAGGVLVSDSGSSLVLEDCTVSGCVADYIGGVCVVNGASVSLSGAVRVDENLTADGVDANLIVSVGSSLVLAGEMTGPVGVTRDVAGDLAVFGEVSDSFAASDARLILSAMGFYSDNGYGYGVPVRADDGETLLVWSKRLGEGATYTDEEGAVYSAVTAEGVRYPVEIPEGIEGLVYNGAEQTGVAARLGFTLSGDFAATDAGTYTATAALEDGYVWSDGTTAAKTVEWSIAKAVYDMSAVSFDDATFIYDGRTKTMTVTGALPDGVTALYIGGGQVLPGEYAVSVAFTGDIKNYEPITGMAATMTIVRSVAVPAPAALVYNAEEQTGVAAGEHYTLSGDVTGTDAGTNYVAVATLEEYCVWGDGENTNATIEIVWTISPAPLTVSAVASSKTEGAADPAAFAYTVEGLQGADTADEVLTGALVRDEGETVGSYAIRQGTLAVAADEPNYVIDSYDIAFFRIVSGTSAAGVFPDLPDGATPDDVAAVLDGIDLGDDAVAEGINGADDPVAAYEDFTAWAGTVTGGEEAVAESEHAWASYKFGVTELFENEPVVTFTAIQIENPADASMRVTVSVTDGGVEKTVSPESVVKLFEMSVDLVTWTGDLTATANTDGSYTVQPDDPTLTSAFIRIRY